MHPVSVLEASVKKSTRLENLAQCLECLGRLPRPGLHAKVELECLIGFVVWNPRLHSAYFGWFNRLPLFASLWLYSFP